MENLNNRKLEGIEPPGFFVGCPEQELHLEMKDNLSKLIEDVDG